MDFSTSPIIFKDPERLGEEDQFFVALAIGKCDPISLQPSPALRKSKTFPLF